MQEIILKIRYFEKESSKNDFLSNPVLFNGQNYQTQKGPGTRDQSLFRLRNKFTSSYKVVLELFQKLHMHIYASQFMTS